MDSEGSHRKRPCVRGLTVAAFPKDTKKRKERILQRFRVAPAYQHTMWTSLLGCLLLAVQKEPWEPSCIQWNPDIAALFTTNTFPSLLAVYYIRATFLEAERMFSQCYMYIPTDMFFSVFSSDELWRRRTQLQDSSKVSPVIYPQP